VDCSSEATARADFKSIGNLCGWALDELDSLHGVKDQLASHDKPSLLLLDNCDDTKTNFSCYIPNSARVSVVLTTRLFDADKYASLNMQDTTTKLFVRMDGLDPASATQLIVKTSRTREQSGETIHHAQHIANALDYHPLAIVVACSLIKSNVYSIKLYAEALKARFAQKELLDTVTEQATYRKVSATFEISTNALQDLAVSDESAQHALDLLDLLAFVHYRNVSEDMFVCAWKCEEEVLTNCMKQDREPHDLSMWHVAQARKYFPYANLDTRKRMLRKARAHLVRLSLVKQNSEDNTVDMHSLVHIWARERLQDGTKPWSAAASILALAGQGSQRLQPYAPQISLHCETNYRLRHTREEINLRGEAMCRIWCNFAWQMLSTYHPQSSDVVKHFAREVQSLSSADADDILRTEPRHMLAVLCLRDRNISQAVLMLQDVVKLRAKLDENHPSRLMSQHELARAYVIDGRTSKAIEIFEDIVRTKEKLAADHPSRLASQHELACAYLEDGRTSQAIETLEYLVQIKEKLAVDHPSRLASQHELARAYLEDGRLSQAIEVFEHIVRTKEKLVAEHPSRLASQHALARAYLEDRRISQAIEIFEHVVQVEGTRLAADHPDRLTSQHELALAYLENGRIPQAIEIFEHVVRIKEKLPADHQERLVSQHQLARAYWHAARFAEADKLMSYVVKWKRRVLPGHHRSRVLSEEVLAKIRKGSENLAAVSKDGTASGGRQIVDAHQGGEPGTI